MEIPIACSLDDVSARSQLHEWHELVADSVVATEWASPSDVRLRLVDDPARLGGIVALAQREKACCPFFDFVIRIDAGACWLGISVPPEAAALLAGLFQRR